MESRSWRRSKWMKTSKTSGWEQDKSRSMVVKLLRTLRTGKSFKNVLRAQNKIHWGSTNTILDHFIY